MTRKQYWKLRRKRYLVKWSKMDWSKQNCELADETGLTRERIRQIRRLVGAPKSDHHHRLRKTAQALQWAEDNLDKLKGLSGSELRRKYGLKRSWKDSSLYTFLRPFLRDGGLYRKHRWDLMNFRLPNTDLERIWRLPHTMAGAYRCRKRLPPSPWRFNSHTGKILYTGRQRQAYHRTVKAEEGKAARYFSET